MNEADISLSIFKKLLDEEKADITDREKDFIK